MASGDSVKPLYELIDQVSVLGGNDPGGCVGDGVAKAHLFDELISYLTGNDVRGFVDHYRRHWDMAAEDKGDISIDDDMEMLFDEEDDSIDDDICASEPGVYWAYRTAEALCKVNPRAGHSADGETIEDRIDNLLRNGTYGPYVLPGDPHGWSTRGHPVATILMEPKGNGIETPLDYHNDAIGLSMQASDLLRGGYIEMVNAAVAVVYCLDKGAEERTDSPDF